MQTKNKKALGFHSEELRRKLIKEFTSTRTQTEKIAAKLSPEDQQVQSMTDASPTKWHLAHSTWFFEVFLLKQYSKNYKEFDASFNYLFNSYYEAIGPRHSRPQRGLLTRPKLEEISDYRIYVNNAVIDFISYTDKTTFNTVATLIELGIHHEKQHQELALMDIKHLFSNNPFSPKYHNRKQVTLPKSHPISWFPVEGGIYKIGADGSAFSFDNEGPIHDVLLNSFKIASRPSTNREFIEFIQDGGYREPKFWHADGWAVANQNSWSCPLYWHPKDSENWDEFTLSGKVPLLLDAPVCHISYYEASAFAAWSGKRLPTEFEWEVAARIYSGSSKPDETNLQKGNSLLRPIPSDGASKDGPTQFMTDVWEWTQSPYIPYPGFSPAKGAVGEYNGKFMINQVTLRGASCITPKGHSRITYRNFFYPNQRWAFSGVRLAS